MAAVVGDERAPQLILRGDLRHKDRMEMLQDSYLRAVAAAAGCQMSKPDPDDGIDWIITHTSASHTADCQVDLKVQLKSTSATGANPENGSVSVRVKNDRFRLLSRSPVMVSRILVAMILPKDVEEWISADHDMFILRHCCYWINLEGRVPTGESETVVSVPTTKIFDDKALCEIMERIGRGGKP